MRFKAAMWCCCWSELKHLLCELVSSVNDLSSNRWHHRGRSPLDFLHLLLTPRARFLQDWLPFQFLLKSYLAQLFRPILCCVFVHYHLQSSRQTIDFSTAHKPALYIVGVDPDSLKSNIAENLNLTAGSACSSCLCSSYLKLSQDIKLVQDIEASIEQVFNNTRAPASEMSHIPVYCKHNMVLALLLHWAWCTSWSQSNRCPMTQAHGGLISPCCLAWALGWVRKSQIDFSHIIIQATLCKCFCGLVNRKLPMRQPLLLWFIL